MNFKRLKLGIIGLGYVGLPLAIEFGKKFKTIGYDKKNERIKQLKKKIDLNKDVKKIEFIKSKHLSFSTKISKLKNCNVYIATIPTPVNKNKKPDLKFIKQACSDISKLLNKNNIIIFESTVYPGLTEEYCIPLIEKLSKLKGNKDFFYGYSPERINPNDKIHTIRKIVKITSGSNKKTSIFIDKLYKKIISAGTFRASSIKVAEAAKVIENTQRDLNIAFMNELCLIFDKLNINTNEVLKAASTKWNFLNFKPGLVGGHCIGVDPYYLKYQSEKYGYQPKIINSGRKTNDDFIDFIKNKAVKITKQRFNIKYPRFLILGLTFKENCLDFRNSKSVELVEKMKKRKFIVHSYDPYINNLNIKNLKNINFKSTIRNNYYHCVVITVAHNYFKKLGQKNINKYLVKDGLIFDIKNVLPKNKNNIYL